MPFFPLSVAMFKKNKQRKGIGEINFNMFYLTDYIQTIVISNIVSIKHCQ